MLSNIAAIPFQSFYRVRVVAFKIINDIFDSELKLSSRLSIFNLNFSRNDICSFGIGSLINRGDSFYKIQGIEIFLNGSDNSVYISPKDVVKLGYVIHE